MRKYQQPRHAEKNIQAQTRCSVGRRAHKRAEQLRIGDKHVGEAKIGDLDGVVAIDQQVLKLKVAVHNVALVAIVEC